MIILLVVIGIALGCGLMGAIAGIMIDRWRRESRQLDTDIAEYEKRGRHAKTQPRTSLVKIPDDPPWDGGPSTREPYETWAEARREHQLRRLTPTHVSAAGIAPVILPEPGTYLPQAGRASGDGTGTMPRIRLQTASTGEIRAIGDELVAAIERGAPE